MSLIYRPSPALRASDEDTFSVGSGEKALFRAVILRAFADSVGYVTDVDLDRGGLKRTRTRTMMAGRSFLLNSTYDFRLICEYADYEPGLVRSKAEEMQAAGWPREMVPTRRSTK